MKLSWKGQLINIPVGEGGESSDINSMNWVFYDSEYIPTNDSQFLTDDHAFLNPPVLNSLVMVVYGTKITTPNGHTYEHRLCIGYVVEITPDDKNTGWNQVKVRIHSVIRSEREYTIAIGYKHPIDGSSAVYDWVGNQTVKLVKTDSIDVNYFSTTPLVGTMVTGHINISKDNTIFDYFIRGIVYEFTDVGATLLITSGSLYDSRVAELPSVSDQWVRYLTDTKLPQTDDLVSLKRVAYPSLNNAYIGDNIFILYGYTDAIIEEVDPAPDVEGDVEVSSIENRAANTEDVPTTDGEVSVDIYNYWICLGRITDASSDAVTVKLGTTFPLTKDSEDEPTSPSQNLWVVGNKMPDGVIIAHNLSIGMQTIGGIRLSVSSDVFGLNRQTTGDVANTYGHPLPNDKFVGYLWLQANDDSVETCRYFVSGTIETSSAETSPPFDYPDTYSLVIDSGYLIETDGGGDVAPADDFETVRVETVVTEGGWHIRKYEDGYVEMILTTNVHGGVNNQVTGPIFKCVLGSYNYPIDLLDRYSENAQFYMEGTDRPSALFASKGNNDSTTSNHYVAVTIRSGAISVSGTLTIHVTGRWK